MGSKSGDESTLGPGQKPTARFLVDPWEGGEKWQKIKGFSAHHGEIDDYDEYADKNASHGV